MDKISYSLAYNRKGKLLQDGTGTISICASLKGKRKYFTTEIKVKPEHWDNKRQRIRPTAPNSKERNTYLSNFIERLERHELDIIKKEKSISLDCLIECITPKEEKTDFLAFFKAEATKKKAIAESTRQVYMSAYKHLSTFKKSILFDDIDYRLIHSFEGYLLEKGINVNSTGKYLKVVKAVINLAINYGLFPLNRYPFRNFKIKTQAANRAYLDPAEIEKIAALQIDPKQANLQQVRDMYLFAIYTGLRFSDIIRISPENIETVEGKKYLVLNMEKTKDYLRLPIYLLFDGKPLELLKQYADPARRFYFDQFTNQFVNRELKEIAQLAGIAKRVTFHTARHTTATYLLYNGVPLSTIQKILGHTKIGTTQIYAKVMDMTTENDLKKVFR